MIPDIRGTLPPALRVYLAGLFDGEGHVGICTGRQWSLRTSITNTSIHALKEIYQQAGRIGSFGYKRSAPPRKLAGVWWTSSQDSAWLLAQIRPWLRVRHEQADVGLQFAALFVASHSRKGVPAENTERRIELHRQLSTLNARGGDTIAPPADPYRKRGPYTRWRESAPLADELKTYLAGLFDGEGSISILTQKNNPSQWTLCITVTLTHQAGLRSVYDSAGRIGSFHYTRRLDKKWKTKYQWKVNGRAAVWLLQQIRPWLHIRAAQADVALQFADLVTSAHGNRWHPPAPDNIAARQRLKAQLNALNARGTA